MLLTPYLCIHDAHTHIHANTQQFMVTVARIPRYTNRLDCTVFMLAFAEDAEFIDSKTAVVQQAVDQVGDSFTTTTITTIFYYEVYDLYSIFVLHACTVIQSTKC
jgi:Ulp1 family protease